jgi:hypothetical protein
LYHSTLGSGVIKKKRIFSQVRQSWSEEEPDLHMPSEWEQILFLEIPDLYHRSPDSSDLQHKSRGFHPDEYL